MASSAPKTATTASPATDKPSTVAMTILVNNTPAVLRADIAFDYVAKNSLFDNKDGYTLEIAFPLKDCLTNMQIFGVTEAIPDRISTPYDCRIIEGDFDKHGILRVLSVTAHELQAQFVEAGPGAQPVQTGVLSLLDGITENITSWDDLTLPELMADVTLTPGDYTYGTDYEQVTFYDEREEKIWDFDEQGHADDGKLFCQWYFHRIVRTVIEQLGYAADFSHLADHYLFWHLLSLNAHFTDQPFATSLPDWTISKFFEQIGHLFAVRVVVDNNAKTIALKSLTEFYNPNTTIEVEPSTDHEVETLDEEQTIDWKDTVCRYADTDTFDDCQWFIGLMEEKGLVTHFDTLAELTRTLQEHMQPVAAEDPAIGRHYSRYDGYAWSYPGDPEDEAQQNSAFRRWLQTVRQGAHNIRVSGYARQFASQLLEAEGYYFLVTEAQSDTLYRIMRRLHILGARSSSSASLGARSSSPASSQGASTEYTLSFIPADWHDCRNSVTGKAYRIPVIQTPEVKTYSFDDPEQTPALLYNILKDGEPETEYYDRFFVALCYAYRSIDGSLSQPLVWTDEVQVTPRILESDDEAYPWFDAIGSDTPDGIVEAAFPRFKDGELLGTTSVDMNMPYVNRVRKTRDVYETLFPLASVPSPFPSLRLSPVDNWRITPTPQSLTNLTPTRIREALPSIDPTRLYRFDFLYKGVPDPKAVYRIHGQKYLCRQLTVQMTADGISDLKQGEFFRILAAESEIRDADMADAM